MSRATYAAVVIPSQASPPRPGGQSHSPTPHETVAVEQQHLFTGWYVVHRASGLAEDFVALSDEEAQRPGFVRSLERVYERSDWSLVRVYGPRRRGFDRSS